MCLTRTLKMRTRSHLIQCIISHRNSQTRHRFGNRRFTSSNVNVQHFYYCSFRLNCILVIVILFYPGPTITPYLYLGERTSYWMKTEHKTTILHHPKIKENWWWWPNKYAANVAVSGFAMRSTSKQIHLLNGSIEIKLIPWNSDSIHSACSSIENNCTLIHVHMRFTICNIRSFDLLHFSPWCSILLTLAKI